MNADSTSGEKGGSTMIIGIVVIGAGLLWWMNSQSNVCTEDADCGTDQKCINEECKDDCTANSDCGTDQECVDGDCVDKADEDNSLESFDSYSNQSLHPGLGSSDLYKTGDPEVRAGIKGVSECAKKCLGDANCVAFHHWAENPDADTEDTCYYWSANQHATETYENLSDALGPGGEGKGAGHRVNAYIKKVQTAAADTWMGYKAESIFINTLQDHQLW